MKTINLYTDGSCLGNPGPGGWAYVLEWGDYRILGADGMAETTNNRQELYAVIYGLERIEDKSRPVIVYSDSEYVVKGVSQWLARWKANGWKNARKREVVNRDLWEYLDQLLLSLITSASNGSKPTMVTSGTSTLMNWLVPLLI